MKNDNGFYKILKFYKCQGVLFFKGKEFKMNNKFSFNLNFTRLALLAVDHKII